MRNPREGSAAGCLGRLQGTQRYLRSRSLARTTALPRIAFTRDDGVRLQGRLAVPTEPRGRAAVLCHPDPRHGGSMDGPLLVAGWSYGALLGLRAAVEDRRATGWEIAPFGDEVAAHHDERLEG